MDLVGKNIFKIGQMLIDPKQVFWKKQYVFACIPFVQLLTGHILIAPRRQVYNFKQLQPAEVFDLSLCIKFLARSMETYFQATSSTIFIQNSSRQQGSLGHLIVHILPRKAGDIKNNDGLYKLIQTYPQDLLKYYNEKINSYGNAYVGKILQGIHEQAKKYEDHLNIAYKKQQQV